MRKIHCLNNISKVGLKSMCSSYGLTDEINSADAILVRSAKMHEIKLSSSVLAVARAGAGVNNIPLQPYADQGIVVFNTPGANANAVKEINIAGMLLASRDIYGGMNWLNANKEDPGISKSIEKAKSQFAGTEISGKTIGIIGMGAIGVMLAKACHALGMNVIGAEFNLERLNTIRPMLDEEIKLVQDKEELYAVCDFISLNLPLNTYTKHMFNQEAFKLMKNGVVLLNFARDGLVNDDDLKVALANNQLRSYVTDFPNAKTANMDGVIAIPHLGASTKEAEDNCASMAISQIENYLEKGIIKNSVNYPDVDPGEFKALGRILVLHRVSNHRIEMLNSVKELITKVKGYKEVQKAGYGVVVFDCDSDITNEVLANIKAIENVILVRKI